MMTVIKIVKAIMLSYKKKHRCKYLRTPFNAGISPTIGGDDPIESPQHQGERDVLKYPRTRTDYMVADIVDVELPAAPFPCRRKVTSQY